MHIQRWFAGLTPLALLPLLALFHAPPAGASFHLNEITKVIVGINGNTTIQAVELKMIAANEHLVNGVSIMVYDANGTIVDTLGTFSGPVSSGLNGRRILCATNNFAVTFGISPDLIIKPGLLVGTGQVSFESPGCLVNALAYGSVTTPINGTTSAPALPASPGMVLVRSIDNATVPSCPLSENASARFGLVSATAATPVNFFNNLAEFVQVYPTASGVDDAAPSAVPLRVYPNPFHAGARIVAPGHGHVAVYDVRGRLVRSWSAEPAIVGPMRLDWDGTNAEGHRLASGIYFVQYGLSPRDRTRVVLLR